MTSELFEYAPDVDLSGRELDAIRAVCLDYIESWYNADADRMRGSLHPDLAKHTLVRRAIDGEDQFELAPHSAASLVEMTGNVAPQPADDRRADVRILAATHFLASAEVISAEMIDLLHLIRLPEGWRIIHALWGIQGGALMTRSGDTSS